MNRVLIFNLVTKYFNNHTNTLAMFMSWFNASCFRWYVDIPGDSRGKVSILGGDSIGQCEGYVYMNMCLIRIDYLNEDIWISTPNAAIFSFVSAKIEFYKRKFGYIKIISCSDFGYCWAQEKDLKMNSDEEYASSHTTWKMYWSCR